jgi:hypothetical protein
MVTCKGQRWSTDARLPSFGSSGKGGSTLDKAVALARSQPETDRKPTEPNHWTQSGPYSAYFSV